MLLLSLDIEANLKSGTQEHIQEICGICDIQIYELVAVLYDTETRKVLERFYYWFFPGDTGVLGNWEALTFNRELLRTLSDRDKAGELKHYRRTSSGELVKSFMQDLKKFLSQGSVKELPILIGKNLHAYDIPILIARGWKEDQVSHRSIDTGTLAMCMMEQATIPTSEEIHSWLVSNTLVESDKGKLHYAMYDAEVNIAVWRAYETFILGESR